MVRRNLLTNHMEIVLNHKNKYIKYLIVFETMPKKQSKLIYYFTIRLQLMMR